MLKDDVLMLIKICAKCRSSSTCALMHWTQIIFTNWLLDTVLCNCCPAWAATTRSTTVRMKVQKYKNDESEWPPTWVVTDRQTNTLELTLRGEHYYADTDLKDKMRSKLSCLSLVCCCCCFPQCFFIVQRCWWWWWQCKCSAVLMPKVDIYAVKMTMMMMMVMVVMFIRGHRSRHKDVLTHGRGIHAVSHSLLLLLLLLQRLHSVKVKMLTTVHRFPFDGIVQSWCGGRQFESLAELTTTMMMMAVAAMWLTCAHSLAQLGEVKVPVKVKTYNGEWVSEQKVLGDSRLNFEKRKEKFNGRLLKLASKQVHCWTATDWLTYCCCCSERFLAFPLFRLQDERAYRLSVSPSSSSLFSPISLSFFFSKLEPVKN